MELDSTEKMHRTQSYNSRKFSRSYRRMMRVRKKERLFRIVTGSYIPHAGYVDWDLVDGKMKPTGNYIKYPKNSNCQKWMKRETSHRARKSIHMPSKGNYHRKLFDYWWTLY